ncbi:PREDICTED: properdin-like [Lepidothrix coronata]|uniref:Properdin-like n=1 Tax=Lepidothrix coronata TaxID=321398 RepID=A0A6J0JAH3_9PASS|nr:PREDICTED: properdin-like [Lepidothrix coronata]
MGEKKRNLGLEWGEGTGRWVLPVGGTPGVPSPLPPHRPPLPPMAPVGLILLLLCAALGPSAATPVWCFARLEEAEGGGACVELLGDEPVPLADCCLNPAYGYRLRPHGRCLSCRQGEWGPWGPWSSCSVTCGEGTQRRGRSRSSGGDDGDRRDWQLQACHLPCCPGRGFGGGVWRGRGQSRRCCSALD